MGKEYSQNMERHVFAGAALFVFVSVTLFGLTSLLSHSDHHAHCPLQGAATVLCESTTIEHIGMWQGMFVAVFLLLFVAGLHPFSRRVETVPTTKKVRLRRAYFSLPRPTLFQELFSSGILNRKEFYAFSV